MYNVYEVFKSDGKRFLLFQHEDHFSCEVWARNHFDCTTALHRGFSELIIKKSENR